MFDYRPLPAAQAPRGPIGIPRVLNLYENYPFWHTVLSQLGFSVILSRRSDHRTFTDGMDSIPSESVCFPAKLAHGHVIDLVRKGIKTIFYPDISYEQNLSPEANQHYNCPIVLSYPEVIRHNVEALQTHQVRLIQPFLSLAKAHRRLMPKRLAEALADFGVTERKRARRLRPVSRKMSGSVRISAARAVKHWPGSNNTRRAELSWPAGRITWILKSITAWLK